jgi:hypothetical protein
MTISFSITREPVFGTGTSSLLRHLSSRSLSRESPAVTVRRQIVHAEAFDWPSNKAKGVLTSIPLHELLSPAAATKEAFSKLGEELFPSARVKAFDYEVFARVSYLDIYDRERVQYFEMSPQFSNPKLEDAAGRREFENAAKIRYFYDDGETEEDALRDIWDDAITIAKESK